MISTQLLISIFLGKYSAGFPDHQESRTPYFSFVLAAILPLAERSRTVNLNLTDCSAQY